MKRERVLLAIVVTILLIDGLLIGQYFRSRTTTDPDADAEAFRPWFWQARGLDLMVQAGLILGGALGIAALLPKDREDRDG